MPNDVVMVEDFRGAKLLTERSTQCKRNDVGMK